MLIAAAIARIRNDLKDVSPGTRWTDAVLTIHVDEACEDYSAYDPMSAYDNSISAARTFSVSTLTGLTKVRGIGYPANTIPPRMRQFDMRDDSTVIMQVADTMSSVVEVYYEKERAIGDIPVENEGLVCRLASAYALEEYAAYSTDKVNDGETERFRAMGGEWKAWAFARLAEIGKAKKGAAIS